jgi:hypothetical protein
MSEATFVLCIEQTGIRAQALLLCASIRAFGGSQAAAPIVAVAPRPGLGVDRDTRAALARLDVEYAEVALNVACPEYGSANRVFAAAWAEARATADWIVVLDSDTVLFDALPLPPDADVALRPIDSKGSASTGPDDAFEPYWRALAALEHVSLDALPFVATTDGRHRVRASYNGGLVVARRSAGLLGRWADLFARSVAAGLRPWRGHGENVHASTGYVGLAASEYWGSNQAALAVAAWGAGLRVRDCPDTCNVPLHLLAQRPDLIGARAARVPLAVPIHVHYHWMFTAPYHRTACDTLRHLGVPADRLAWLEARLPIA